ncbi:hypothetical protein MK805_17275 [Shimazuella sp. AN120528]|uniref:hypothetical protein n=1 Tax=Shimazuella soli TaxID=1892854 RepID=UPI001F0D7208|nr:hypothetical protein [Shimazuella soli]MCH5586687.1 hypothetical protein [Shimazuella soli]
MDWKIYYDDENKGQLPFHSLPVFQLFCEHIGFQMKWNQQEKILHLAPMLQGKKVYFMPMKQDDNHNFMLDTTKAFLSDTGIQVTVLQAKSSLPDDGEIMVKLKFNTSDKSTTSRPKFTIFYSQGLIAKKWAEMFAEECQKHGIIARIKEEEKKSPIPVLELRSRLPEAQGMDRDLEEQISLILATVLLRGCAGGNTFSFLPFLSLDSMKLLFPKEERSSLTPSAPEALQKKKPQPQHTEVPPQNKGNTTANPVPIPPFRMEVCFDYQIVFPTSEEDDYLVLGNMYLKNTGMGALPDPHICIQVPPSSHIQLKGQIIPPQMVDTAGVQSFSGDSAVGWTYVDEDWRNKVKELGEYWVRSIQPLIIKPGETIPFSNFQLSVPRDSSGDIMIEGFVHYKGLNLQYPAANKIALSFT